MRWLEACRVRVDPLLVTPGAIFASLSWNRTGQNDRALPSFSPFFSVSLLLKSIYGVTDFRIMCVCLRNEISVVLHVSRRPLHIFGGLVQDLFHPLPRDHNVATFAEPVWKRWKVHSQTQSINQSINQSIIPLSLALINEHVPYRCRGSMGSWVGRSPRRKLCTQSRWCGCRSLRGRRICRTCSQRTTSWRALRDGQRCRCAASHTDS